MRCKEEPRLSTIRSLLTSIVLIVLPAVPSVGGANLGYYAQAIGGQLEILSKRRSIEKLLANPETDSALRTRLGKVLEMRRFASRELGLPDNKSYRSYVDLGRAYVVWNVFAAPELSLQPVQWCFVFVGCLNYRGYFTEGRAQKFAGKLRARNHDVYVAGIAAYSTLGWFNDPMLNTILTRPESDVAGLIFHELAHQLIYARDDTPFNESFAMTVEHEGVRRWLEHAGTNADYERYRLRRRLRDEFIELVMRTRERLQRLYAAPLPAEEKRAGKARAFAGLKAEYAARKRDWGGYDGYDRWFAQELTNAHLVPIGLYHQYVPAFEALLARERGDLRGFYAAVEALAELPKEERHARLDALAARHPGSAR